MKVIIGSHTFAIDHRLILPALLLELDWWIVIGFVWLKLRRRRRARRLSNG